MGIGADALTRLSDVLARRPELAKEKINLIWSQCPQQELLKHQSESRLNAGQLSGILAMARYLAHCGPAQRKLDLLQPVLEFIEALPKVAKIEGAWPPSFEASEFFSKLTEYLVMIAESWPLASTNVGKAVAKFILTLGVLDNEGVHIFNSLEIKTFLSSLTQNWPPLDHSKSEEVVQCLLEHWIMPQAGVPASLSSAESSCYGSPLTGNERDRKDSEPGLEGLIENMSIREESPLSTPRRTHFINSVGTPSRSPEREGVDHASNTRTLSNVSGNGIIDRFITTNGWTNALSGSAPYQSILDSEGLDGLKRQDTAFRLLIHILNGLERTGMKLKETYMRQLKEAATQQLKALLPILKMRKRDLTAVGVQMKAKMNLKLEVCQVAAVIETKCLLGSGDKGKIPKGLQETLTLLMDAAFACISSPWRRLKACECLFDALLSGVAEISVVHGRQILGVVLYRLKHLILSACAYADTWGTNQGAMFKSVVKGSCSIIKAGWNWDRSTIEPFLLSLAAHIRDRTEDEKEKQTAIAMRQLNVIPLLADLATMLNKCEAIEMVMPVFLESLQEGDASVPCLLRLRLLDAVARMATLGFEKSYRETVVLLTRSYLEKLSTVGSTHSRTLAPEATTERVDTLPVAFQVIARGLCQPELRSDYLHRMLILCSDVGLVAEAKSGRSGADLLGPLLPAVAEICRDFDAACNTDPSLLKLFRNLWFYIVLFGLAPAIQKVQPSAKVAASMSSLGSVSVQAVAGPYKWSSQWAEAVQCITEATPPLVVSSVKWVEDELELNALHNPGSRRGSSNEKAAIGQRAALAAALGGRVEASSLNAISGVKATYLLAVAFLEVLRFIRNGGIMKSVNHKGEAKSALCCTLKYLETPNLLPIVSQCLTAIVHRAFDSAMSWLAEKSSSTGVGADEREAAISLHACFLIQHLTHQNEIVRETADALLSQLRNRFPQVLWNVRCVECLLHLVENNPKDLPSIDHGTFVSSRMLLQQRVREWMTYSLLLAPSTTQGLLQEEFRKRNTWQNTARTSELLSIFSEMRLDMAKGEALQSSQSTVIPAVIAAAAAAAGANPGLAEGGNMEVLSTSLISANISANMKSSYLGEIVGMKKLYLGLNKNGPKGSPGPWFNTSEDVSGEQLIKEDDLALNAILFDLQSLQQFVTASEKGQPVESSAFREACMHATALLLSDTGLNRDDPLESFLQLLRLLCWCPAYIFTPGAMETGILIWTWLLSAAPHLGCSILSELVDAWLWTVDTGHGLFAHGIKNSGPVAELRPHLTPGEPDCSTTKDIVEGITAHQLWLGFFLDRFEVVRHSSSEQLLLIGRMIQGSVKNLSHFSSHSAARGSFFTLMLLGLKYCSSQLQNGSLVGNVGAVLLEDRIYHASLTWFAVEPGWYEFEVNGAAQFESQTMALFVQQLLSGRLESISNVGAEQRSGFQENAQACVGMLSGQSEGIQSSVGKSDSNNCGKEKRKQLLLMLCQHEADRLDTWANPLKELSLPRLRISADGWIEYAKIAWSVDPRIAFSLIARFPSVMPLKAEVTSLVQAHLTELSEIPEALPYFVTPKAVEENSLVLQLLPHWAPCSITRALEFLTPSYKGNTRVMAYVLRVLESYPPERVTFFMPQLVQALRYDEAGLVEGYLVVAAKRSNLFAHILIWQLQGEEPPPEEVSKELLATKGNSLYDIVPKVKQRIIDSFTPEAYDYFVREFRFFDEITSISGKLFPLPKEERRAAIRKELEKIKVEGEDLYLPTAPNTLVCGIELDSGVPLQSAAKVPIMITFDVIDKEEDCNHPKLQACIFKVGDDCRQDVLALQVIALLRDIFKAVNLNLYLFPYGVLPTGYGRGIIEVVPNSRSRNQMGEMTDGGLYEIFQQEYGPVGSQSFEAARDNFIVSSAGYAVASLLLQPKDRHNGNLLFDSEGRLVHIDFGFILETSPGGNLRFESAHFKLSHEMTQLLDPSGIMKSDTWNRFVSLCVKGYLAARLHMDGIVNTVLLMKDSGLPCFGRGDPIGNLRKRFHPEMTEREAANFMIRTCADAYNKWTTTGYDLIQYLQQGIEK